MNLAHHVGKIALDDFLAMRENVLKAWPTGHEASSLEESCTYQNNIPMPKRFYQALRKADVENATLVQPRAGVCLPNEHIKLLKHLQSEGNADLLPTTIDSYTRQNRYTEAQHGIEESMKNGRSLLNGFPAVNYGVKVCKDITSAVDKPIQVRHGTADARLLAEITMAGGFTAFEGGGISYNIPYTKNVPLETSIAAWQYVDRLMGYYAEQGIIINREPFGPLTGTLVPPSIAIAISILEALLAAEQGVVDITVGYGQCGNIYQDIAALRTLKKLARKHLDKHGFNNVYITTVFHQWMGGFPALEAQAFGVISWGAATAALANATKVISKSPHEAHGVPTAEANAQGINTTKQLINMIHGQQIFNSTQIEKESELIEMEVACLLDKVEELSPDDLALGVMRSFSAGVLDVPFSPSKMAAGAVVPVRDIHGAVRIMEFGNMPFSKEIKAFHQEQIAYRAKVQQRSVSFQMVTDDIYAVSKGRLVSQNRN